MSETISRTEDLASRVTEYGRIITASYLDEKKVIEYLGNWFKLRRQTAEEFLKESDEDKAAFLREILEKCDYNIKKALALR